MEDTLALNKALAIAYGFDMMNLPASSGTSSSSFFGGSSSKSKTQETKYIDLWPIQISSADSDATHAWDTYTMVLQLGTILSFTGTWKTHKLRVSVFVEEEKDMQEERTRVRSLLDNLRIPASLRVFNLSSGSVASYQSIVLGKQPIPTRIETSLGGDPWWEALKQLRREDIRRAKAAAKKEEEAAAAAGSHPNLPAPQAIAGTSGDFSDDDSDLSDELANLGEDDWLGWGVHNQSDGLRRSKTSAAYNNAAENGKGRKARSYSFGGGSVGLPDEPSGRPLMSTSASSNQSGNYGSIGDSNAHLKSASYASNSSGGTLRPPKKDGPSRPTLPSTIPSEIPSAASSRRSSFASSAGGSGVSSGSEEAGGTLKASDRAQFLQASQPKGNAAAPVSRSRANSEASTAQRPPMKPVVSSNSKSRNSTYVKMESQRHASAPVSIIDDSYTSTRVSFNELPNRAQYLILNELIRSNSSESDHTSVVLTALPAPEPGTSEDEAKCLKYLAQLESLFDGGVPVLGVHAKTLTVSCDGMLNVDESTSVQFAPTSLFPLAFAELNSPFSFTPFCRSDDNVSLEERSPNTINLIPSNRISPSIKSNRNLDISHFAVRV